MVADTFREETRRWLVANAPAAVYAPPRTADELCWGGKKTRYPDDVKRWLDVMAERGWTAPTWPREYGGGGGSAPGAEKPPPERAEVPRPPPPPPLPPSAAGPPPPPAGTPAR